MDRTELIVRDTGSTTSPNLRFYFAHVTYHTLSETTFKVSVTLIDSGVYVL